MLKQFRKPDLKAPRYRPLLLNPLDREFFRSLRKQHPELREFSDTLIRSVIKISNEQIWKDILEFRDGVEFPEFLGYGFLGTCPKKIGKNVNYKLSAEHQQVIEHRNWESDGYLATIFFTNFETKYQFKFHDLWTFTAGRNFTREVGRVYPENWKRYIQVDHTLKISRLFRKEKAKKRHNKKTEILLEVYDEFEGL